MQAHVVFAGSLQCHRRSPSRSHPATAPCGDALRRTSGSRRARLQNDRQTCASGRRYVRPEACAQSTQRKRPARRIWSLMIDCHSVMNGGARESIIPRRGTVVEICSGVASEIDALPPQIDVQLIGLKRAARVIDRRESSPRNFRRLSGNIRFRQMETSGSGFVSAARLQASRRTKAQASSQGPGWSAGRLRTAAPNCSSGRKSRYSAGASGKSGCRRRNRSSARAH